MFLSLVGQSNEKNGCNSGGNIFDFSNTSIDSAFGHHRRIANLPRTESGMELYWTVDWFPSLIKLHFRYAYDVW